MGPPEAGQVEDGFRRKKSYGQHGIRLLTVQYYARRKFVEDLERRISRTDTGLEWVYRVRSIGRPNP
jgi:hypothetical protein